MYAHGNTVLRNNIGKVVLKICLKANPETKMIESGLM